MTRWGFIGFLAVAGCLPDESSHRDAQLTACPGITAGMLPGEPHGKATAGLDSGDEDGRERVIIRYRREDGVTAAQVHQLVGQVTATFRNVPAVAARVTPEERLALALDPRVESIEPDQKLYALGTSAPTALALATTLAGTREYVGELRRVQALEVWDQDGDGLPDPGAVTGAGVKVCVIDSGLDLDHPELRDAVVAARDFLDGDDAPSDRDEERWGSGHGTHVAGIIAARPGLGGRGGPVLDERGLMGVAPGAQLIIARVLNLEGSTHMSLVMKALEYCQAEGAKVASLSLGGSLGSLNTEEGFKAALDGGMLVVAAAGNEGQGLMSYPASDPSVLGVGALDNTDRRAVFSSYGEGLALMAPGVDVLSTFPQGRGSFAALEVGDSRPMSRSLLYAPTGDTWGSLVDCGMGESVASCGEDGSCRGFVAYVHPSAYVRPDRAIVNVMRQGARAVIFASELMEGGAEILSVPQRGTWVPSVTITQAASTVMERQLGATAKLSLRPADYAYMSGTSMATPYVSGIAALLFSARPSATPAEVKAALLSSAKDLGDSGYDEQYGHGLVQARRALEALVGPVP
ncbi:S8 family serine peptidase [Myxococcus sp. CA040A]|uniref:S8 family serine peptidase n=1 Tax=Myxococcus sp. CA040A TaxID=2741738 RepID=UPI00157AD3D6|nr:S8 family serine peptidase [Myxococcus sp. CA040A]NTX07520.1 S8 family serine peptidase [Myxococcus sp. CA040A]